MNRHVTDPAVERYLDRLRAALRGTPGPELDEIVQELRGHIAERAGSVGDIERVLRLLGDPEDLAVQYRTERVTKRAEYGGSPIAILHSLLLLRRRSASGWITLALAAFGYAWALALAGAAIEKILSPRDVGLWYQPGRLEILRLRVDGPGPAGTRELLGWWIVPFGLVACAALLYATNQFGLWRIRRARGKAGSRAG